MCENVVTAKIAPVVMEAHSSPIVRNNLNLLFGYGKTIIERVNKSPIVPKILKDGLAFAEKVSSPLMTTFDPLVDRLDAFVAQPSVANIKEFAKSATGVISTVVISTTAGAKDLVQKKVEAVYALPPVHATVDTIVGKAKEYRVVLVQRADDLKGKAKQMSIVILEKANVEHVKQLAVAVADKAKVEAICAYSKKFTVILLEHAKADFELVKAKVYKSIPEEKVVLVKSTTRKAAEKIMSLKIVQDVKVSVITYYQRLSELAVACPYYPLAKKTVSQLPLICSRFHCCSTLKNIESKKLD